MSDHLNPELILEILLRLPIEALVKCTAVCKSWNSLIKSPAFISTHLGKTISFNNSTDTHLLLFRFCTYTRTRGYYSKHRMEHYSLRFDNEDFDEYKQLYFPSKFRGFGCFRVAGSHNGLVCLASDSTSYVANFILWNPTIKKAIRVPKPNFEYSSHGGFEAFLGLGFDSKTNDYKLLRFVQLLDRKETVAEIYSLNANCWKIISHGVPKYRLWLRSPRIYGPSFVNGAIHLPVIDKEGKRNLVLAFDVSEEVFSEILLADCLSHDYMRLSRTQLLKYGQSSIAAMTCEAGQIHLWAMEEYGVATSWTKLLEESRELVSRVLFFKNKEEALVAVEGQVFGAIDFKKENIKVFGSESVESLEDAYPVVDSFVESLVLLGKSNGCWDVIVSDEDPQDDANR